MSEIRYHRPAILDRIPRDNHAVIEAGAGCGKTHTIEHLVLDLMLATPCTLEEILVVTFTEKATTELRSRIRALLERVLYGGAPIGDAPGVELRTLDETARIRLEAALFSFDRAPIFTIHAFCQRVLSELAFDSGMSFQVEVVDSRGAFHTAFRAELREQLASDGPARALLAEWLGDSTADKLEDLLYESYRNRWLEMRRAQRAGDAPLEVRAVDWFLPRVANRFGRDKREKGQIDYDDMLSQVWRGSTGRAATRSSRRCARACATPWWTSSRTPMICSGGFSSASSSKANERIFYMWSAIPSRRSTAFGARTFSAICGRAKNSRAAAPRGCRSPGTSARPPI